MLALQQECHMAQMVHPRLVPGLLKYHISQLAFHYSCRILLQEPLGGVVETVETIQGNMHVGTGL